MSATSTTIQLRNKIISELYLSKEFNDCINKMDPPWLRDDLRQEVSVILLTKPPEVICGLSERNELRWFVVRIMLNMVRSSSSQWTKTYRRHYTDVIPEVVNKELNGRVARECQEQAVLRFINTELYWYDKEIIQMYMKLGSYRDIEKETGIPWESAYGTVRRIQKRIKEEVLNAPE